ncbi:MAG: glyoxalase/bleomycin resistance/dioxygenase protein [Rhodoferax sp.]|nr:glyoxalase/bleomycin resistance/dioxygenase protein [Rhodoferax sp.]
MNTSSTPLSSTPTPVAQGSQPTNDLCFSHFGFFVSDMQRMAAFYKDALRFTQTDTGRLGATEIVFLSRNPEDHHQIVLMSGRPDPLPFNVINQISLLVPDLQALRKYHDRLLAHGASDMQPVTHGNAISIYCRDPEGNRLELFMHTQWYCDQPLREPIDFSRSDAEIIAQSDAIARRAPRLQTRAERTREMAERMAADQRV